MSKDYDNISDIINCEYLESDLPESLITENGHIERIGKEILETVLEYLEPYLKKSFENKKDDITRDIIGSLEEDYNIIDSFRYLADNILHNIDNNYGKLQIDKSIDNTAINPMWNLPKNKMKRI